MAAKFLTGVDLNGQRARAAGDPQTATDLATKGYIDALVQGLRWKDPVRAATTGNITLSGPQSIDTVSVVAGDRVLVKNQTTGSENGIYLAAAGAWTRALDADSTSDLDAATVLVQEGTANADRGFTQTADGVVVGTDASTWVEFGTGSGTAYSADGNGIELVGTTFSLELDTGAGAGLSKSATGLKVAPSIAGDGLTFASGVVAVGGGTGITVSADGVAVDTATVVTTPSTVVRKYATDVDALVAGTPTTVTHGLGTTDITAQLIEKATGAFVYADIVAASSTTLTVTSSTAAAQGVYRIVVHG